MCHVGKQQTSPLPPPRFQFHAVRGPDGKRQVSPLSPPKCNDVRGQGEGRVRHKREEGKKVRRQEKAACDP